MIGASPLRHPVALDCPRALELMPPEVLAEFTAWLDGYALPHPLAEVDRVAIAERHLFVRYRGDRAQLGPAVAELTSHPSAAMLAGLVRAGVLVCAARMTNPDDTERWRCNVLVDAEGRHTGSHADGRFGDGAEWPNGNPAPAPAGEAIAPALEDLPFLPALSLGLPGPAHIAPPAQLVPAVPDGTPSRHRGVYVLGDETIARALRLPAGQHIMAIAADFERMAVLVQAEGEGLPEVAEGMQAPTVGGGWWGMTPPGPHHLAQLPPPQRHAAVLVAVEGTVLEDARALQGRLRILARHAPVERTKHPEEPHFCGACIERPDYAGETAADWPCADYRDAAGGLLELPADPDDEDDPDATGEIGGAQ